MRLLRLLVLMMVLPVFACGGDGIDGGDGDGDGDADGSGQVDAGAPSGDIAFMEACDIADDRCIDGETCFEYGEGGMFCSHECTSDEQCPAPSRGCNNKGICKRP